VDPGARALTVHRSGRSPIVLGAEDRISLEPVHVRRFVDLVTLLGV
jgi:hypothetical protein